MPDALMDALLSLTTGVPVAAWQAGGSDGGIVLSPVEIIGAFSALAGAIAYMFKTVVDLGNRRVADRDAEIGRTIAQKEGEIARLAGQNERLVGLLFRSTTTTERALAVPERVMSAGGAGDV